MDTKTEFTCQYCKKSFQKETTLAVHVCELKKRYQSKNEQGIRLGLQAYLRFYEITQGSTKPKTFDDFAKSPYYRAFAKFGQYCIQIRAINPAQLIEWLLKKNKKIDHWAKDSTYSEYLAEYIRIENVADALVRAIERSIEWEEETGHPAHDMLRFGNSNAIAYAISTGRISPWAIYNSESGQAFLEGLTPDQVQLIWGWIDPEFWQKKFKQYPADQAYAQEILKQAGW
jgi:hypothetical protein